MKRRTLAQQLFFSILPIVLAMLVLVGGLAFYSCRYEINYIYDTQLVNNANVLWTLVEDELSEEEHRGQAKQVENPDIGTENASLWNGDADDYGDARMFRIWREGKIAMFSDTAPPASVPARAPGFSIVTYNHEPWRVFTLVLHAEHVTIEMGEKLSLRNGLIWNILLNLFVPLAVLIPLIGLALWRGIRGGLSVTRSLVSQIQSRSPDDLSFIRVDNLPRDLAPLGHSINKLFIKLAQSISAERRFSDHAAHQLRTPLAGSKLLIQMLGSADSEAERNAILADLAISNEQAAQLVHKMLIAARVSHQPITLRPVNLYQAAAQGMAALAAIARQKHLEMVLEGDEQLAVLADDTLLALMVENVIENAIKYTPQGGHIHVAVARMETQGCLSITDNGPGIPDTEKTLVFQRFYRTQDAESEGSGLGLTIVADIIDRLDGTVTLTTPASGQGLRVALVLPNAA